MDFFYFIRFGLQFFPPRMESPKIKKECLDKEVSQLYTNIVRKMKPSPSAPLAAIVRAPATDNLILRFDEALLRTVNVINKRVGLEYMSLCYEGNRRWSMMGSVRAEWMEFEYVSAKHFKVTKFLRGSSSVICSFRHHGADMEGDIRNAFKIIAQG
jgi:hypothetical protein